MWKIIIPILILGTFSRLFWDVRNYITPYYTVTFYSGDYGGIRTHYNVFHKPIKTLYCIDACGVDDDTDWSPDPNTLKTVEIDVRE